MRCSCRKHVLVHVKIYLVILTLCLSGLDYAYCRHLSKNRCPGFETKLHLVDLYNKIGKYVNISNKNCNRNGTKYI